MWYFMFMFLKVIINLMPNILLLLFIIYVFVSPKLPHLSVVLRVRA